VIILVNKIILLFLFFHLSLIILEISDKLRNNEITEDEAISELYVLFNISDNFSDNDVRNIVLEMKNEAVKGLVKEKRWDMQRRLREITLKWKI
jgi:hypothetical protein